MQLNTESYLEQKKRWPQQGQHILASFDDTSVVVYQAYRPGIGHYAARHGSFGGDFSLSRMSWIKPNFLWMMFRSGWGTKEKQEVTLAVRIQRTFFDTLLEKAVASSFGASGYADFAEWRQAVSVSGVRLQWDPDHAPSGGKLERRALQLGLRGPMLAEYARNAIVAIDDISDFVAEQRNNAAHPGSYENLRTPRECVYVPADPETRHRLGLSSSEGS